jgi:hypothetical protein
MPINIECNSNILIIFMFHFILNWDKNTMLTDRSFPFKAY